MGRDKAGEWVKDWAVGELMHRCYGCGLGPIVIEGFVCSKRLLCQKTEKVLEEDEN